MKTIEISNELYDRLKSCVVDPFDDTPEMVINRLIEIVEKAKSAWTSWETQEEEAPEEAKMERAGATNESSWDKQVEGPL
jgi:predicted CopG family antitoxin